MATRQKTTKKPEARLVKQVGYKSFRLHKPIKRKGPKLPTSWKLFRQTLYVLRRNKKTFAGIIVLYFVLSLVLVKGFGIGGNIAELRDGLNEVIGENVNQFSTGFALYGYMLQTITTQSSDVATNYQTLLLIVFSLAIIWIVRQYKAGEPVSVRGAFYKGMYPVIPFILVLVVVGLQLIPLLIGSTFYQLIIGSGVAVGVMEHVFWIVICGLFTLLTVYMLCSSLFALYIVTLPDMTPMKALRSSRALVLHRRMRVVIKLAWLPIMLLLVTGLILIPLIVVAPAVAEWLFFVVTLFGLLLVHVYMYCLYRELLNE